MGYTHTWEFSVPKGVRAAVLESAYQKAILECSKIAHVYNKECRENGEDWARLSGYTAHAKPGTYGGIFLNGKQDEACETFQLREHFKQNFELDNGLGYCKTNRKPYDTVVVACLAVLKYRLGDAIKITTDGIPNDWVEGISLARKVIRRKVPYLLGKTKG